MSKFKFALGMLVATGGLGAAAAANAATTINYGYSGLDAPQNVDILGTTQYTYGHNDYGISGSFLKSTGSAQMGSYTDTPTSPYSDSYGAGPIKTEWDGFGSRYDGDSYANLKFTVGDRTYVGTAKFHTETPAISFAGLDGEPEPLPPVNVVLDSVTYGAVPEPESWALLIAGAGLAGAALRRNRRQAAAA